MPLPVYPTVGPFFEDLTTLFSLARHLKRNAIIAFIDLNDFKLINDRYGHEAGDQFLVEVGKRLTEEKQQDDIIGRLGGDEFLVASLSKTDNEEDNTQINQLKTRLNACIAGEYWLGSSVHIILSGSQHWCYRSGP
jgi:diguanylate cyclase with GAF sensor